MQEAASRKHVVVLVPVPGVLVGLGEDEMGRAGKERGGIKEDGWCRPRADYSGNVLAS